MVKETEEHEQFENSRTQASLFHRHETNLSELGRARIEDISDIPETLETNNFSLCGVKKFKPFSQLVKAKIDEQFPHLNSDRYGTYFVEAQDRLLLISDHLKYDDSVLQ